MASYTIDGNDLKTTYGITVLNCSGDLDFLKRKGKTSHDWKDEDGIEAFTQSRDIKFEARTITLNCCLTGNTKADFLSKLSAFKTVLYNNGTHALYRSLTGKTHNVFFEAGASIDPPAKWVLNGKNTAFFTLKLTEPEPSRD